MSDKRSTTIPSKYPYTLVNGVLVDAQGKPEAGSKGAIMSSDDLGDGYQERRGKGWKKREAETDDTLLANLKTYEIRDFKGNLLTTVQGSDLRSVLGVMMLVWGEEITVTRVRE